MTKRLLKFLVWRSVMLQLNLQWKHSVLLLCIDNKAYGVYVIWNVSSLGVSAEYVGSGKIADRLSEHGSTWAKVSRYRNNRYRNRYDATYSEVTFEHAKGVEKILAEKLTPTIGDRYPDVDMVKVNAPHKPLWYSNSISR